MAFGKRAYSTFYQQGTNTQIDVEIHEDGFDPAGALPMLLSNNPIYESFGPDGDKYKIIKGREATINIVVKPSDDYSWLYTNDDRELKVIIKEGTVIEWTGFVVTDQYNEEQSPVRTLSVVANDQLGLLDTKPYTFGYPAVSPTGYQKAIIVLANILSKTGTTKTGLDLQIYCQMNLYETTMNVTDDDDPLDQAYVNQDLWIHDDLSPYSCREVIEDILKPFQCRVLQSAGVWWIQRVPDMADSSIDYRIFNRDGVQTGYSSLSPQISGLTKLATGSLQFTSGWKQRDIEVDYGLKPSLIPSFDLPDSAFVSDTEITGWTNSGTIWSRIHSTKGNVMAAYTNSREAFDDSLYINADPVAVTMDHELNLTIKTGRIENVIFSLYCKVRIFIVDGTGTATSYYHDDQTWGGVDDITGINFPKVNTIEELVEQSITIKDIPFNGNLWIRIYAPYRADLASNNGWFYFKDIQLTGNIAIDAGSDHIQSQIFTDYIWAETNYIPDAETIRISDGLEDDSLIPFYNGFITIAGLVGSRLWVKKSLIGTATPLPLISHDSSWGQIADSWWWQYETQNKRYDGSFLGTIHFHNTVVIDTVVYLLNDIEIDLKRNRFSGTMIEIKPETPGTGGGSLTLKSRGLPSDAGSSSSGLVSHPGGDDNQLQIKSGGDFEGTTGITYDPTNDRILKGALPMIEYRANTETVVAGTHTIVFGVGDPDPFIAGDDPAVPPFWAVGTNGRGFLVTPTNITINGFDITVSIGCTFTYLAFVKR